MGGSVSELRANPGPPAGSDAAGSTGIESFGVMRSQPVHQPITKGLAISSAVEIHTLLVCMYSRTACCPSSRPRPLRL